jgi:arylamine N-acetyltransferase
MREELRDRVLDRLGFSSEPSIDLNGLSALYRAWCMNIPFDNVRKMIALRAVENPPLPGMQADNFFEAWIAHGSGGTCWPSSNALYELVCSLGFDARRVAGSMRDLGIINHGSVKVKIEHRDWLIDSSFLTGLPLPLDEKNFISSESVFAVEVEPSEGTHVIWVDVPSQSTYLPCRLLLDPVEHSYCLAAYEASRERSPFNQRLHALRKRSGEMIVLSGRTSFRKTASGVESRELSPDELCRALGQEIGISDKLIEQWVNSGALKDSFEPPTGPKPPAVDRKPPSQR